MTDGWSSCLHQNFALPPLDKRPISSDGLLWGCHYASLAGELQHRHHLLLLIYSHPINIVEKHIGWQNINVLHV